MELFIILIFNMVSGVFALSEIALISVKKQRMVQLAENGNLRAVTVLGLLKNPEGFLSAVQIGITLIGIVSGVYGGATLTDNFRPVVEKVEVLRPYANQIAYTLVVALITYLSIVIGELIPKTLAMKFAEPVALSIAGFIRFFSRLAYPFVWLLTISTNLVFKLFGIAAAEEEKLTEEELRYVIKTAGRQGLLDKEESDLHHNVLAFSELKAKNVMTHRLETEWLDITDSLEVIEKQLRESNYSQFPVCDDGYDHTLGYAHVKDFFARKDEPGFSLRSILREPVFVPENLYAIDVLQQFKKQKCYYGIVVDEFGAFEGVITLHDLSEALVGDLPDNNNEPPAISKRADGSLLINGSILVEDLNEYLETVFIPDKSIQYSTLAGFVIQHLERIPVEGDQFDFNGFNIEIVDKDGPRIDKVVLKQVE
jgi:putative hemolysin